MARSVRLWPVLLALCSLLPITLAACMLASHLPYPKPVHTNYNTAATSFCKCTCFGNSTIIALSGTSSKDSTSSPASSSDSKTHRGTCNDCNRKFCLDYNLPICKNAKDEDVMTTCFQRDSAKDEAVVFIFITATVGLLVYAAVRPWVEAWAEKVKERRSYMPISSGSSARNAEGANES